MARIANLPAQRKERLASDPTSAAGRKYLYAIVADSQDRTYGTFGLDGSVVHSISDGSVAAIVSDVPNGRIRPERRHLAVHQDVLKRLLEQTTPLPMAFGIIADGPKEIHKILSANREALLWDLHRLQGKVEMGLRVTWDVPNVFEYFVDTHPELRAARDRLLGGLRQPSQEDKIEVGRMFERLLHEDRDACADQVESVLSRCCGEIKRLKCRDEREVMNLACLVERAEMAAYEEGILESARLFDNNFAFDYHGPWAPHNFVSIDLQLE